MVVSGFCCWCRGFGTGCVDEEGEEEEVRDESAGEDARKERLAVCVDVDVDNVGGADSEGGASSERRESSSAALRRDSVVNAWLS